MFIPRNGQGVSLIELLITLVITIILTLASVPVFVNLIKNHRLTAAAENLYYDLQYARTEAVKRNASVYVSFTTGDNWCYGINVGSACNCLVAGNCTLATTSASAPNQTSLSMTGYAGNSIIFEGSHASANASGSVTLTLYQQTELIRITVGKLGNFQMCSTGISGYTAC